MPRNVGPPPISPSSARKPQLGFVPSPAIGPQMPKPSVALCSPKPMISVTARLILLAAAAWPIARPSPKLWTPMPTAISSASCFPGVERVEPACGSRTRRSRRRPGRRASSRAGPRAPSSTRSSRRAPSGRARSRRRRARRATRSGPSGAHRARAAIGSTAPVSTSQSRKSRMPVASADSAARAAGPSRHPADRHAEEDRAPRRSRRAGGCGPCSWCKGHLTDARQARWRQWRRVTPIDEYLETIYFLAFPIGEYTPKGAGLAPARLARRRDAARLARLGRRDAEAARGRRA